MLLTSTEDGVVTVVRRPERTGWKAERNGSALCRTLWTSGTPSLHTSPEALLAAYCLRWEENSDSVARDGWTEIMVSEER